MGKMDWTQLYSYEFLLSHLKVKWTTCFVVVHRCCRCRLLPRECVVLHLLLSCYSSSIANDDFSTVVCARSPSAWASVETSCRVTAGQRDLEANIFYRDIHSILSRLPWNTLHTLVNDFLAELFFFVFYIFCCSSDEVFSFDNFF